MEFKPFRNGDCRTMAGSKEVAFDPETLELRPILYRVYSGYVPDRGTVQGIKVGDIVASVHWSVKETTYKVHRYDVDDITPTEEAELWIQLRKKHTWLDAWLEPSERSETVLPEDVIHPDAYLSTVVKNARIKSTLERFGLPFEVMYFSYSKKGDLKLIPRKLGIDLDAYESKHVSITIDGKEIDQAEAWYGSNGNGTKATGLFWKPSYVEMHPDFQSESLAVPGIKGWDKWKYVIRIKKGVTITDDKSHGASIDIWINHDRKSLVKLEQRNP